MNLGLSPDFQPAIVKIGKAQLWVVAIDNVATNKRQAIYNGLFSNKEAAEKLVAAVGKRRQIDTSFWSKA